MKTTGGRKLQFEGEAWFIFPLSFFLPDGTSCAQNEKFESRCLVSYQFSLVWSFCVPVKLKKAGVKSFKVIIVINNFQAAFPCLVILNSVSQHVYRAEVCKWWKIKKNYHVHAHKFHQKYTHNTSIWQLFRLMVG